MDELTRAFYELKCEVKLTKSRGNEYQNLFADIMERKHGSDFIRVKPWGNVGDRKCDGYLISSKQLFQCYAPNQMEAAKATAKIEEDFALALPYWGVHIQHWTFVHNAWDGLGPDVSKTLLDIRQAHSSKVIDHWGPNELQDCVMTLDLRNLQKLFGYAPTNRNIQLVRVKDIQLLLNQVAVSLQPSGVDLRPVPKDKLDFNGLSDNVKALLTAGRQKEALVGDTLNQWPVIGYADQLASHFHQLYLDKKHDGMDPDAIFADLMSHAAGDRSDVDQTAAVLSLLAYLFFNCDIFERVPAT